MDTKLPELGGRVKIYSAEKQNFLSFGIYLGEGFSKSGSHRNEQIAQPRFLLDSIEQVFAYQCTWQAIQTPIQGVRFNHELLHNVRLFQADRSGRFLYQTTRALEKGTIISVDEFRICEYDHRSKLAGRTTLEREDYFFLADEVAFPAHFADGLFSNAMN